MEKDKFTIKDLDLFYGDFQALKKISMHIPEKEITAFIGPSGCGKSTLLKSLNRMNDLVEGCKITGTLLLDGEPINQMKNVNLLRKRVGMVFQKPNPFPMSIYDNVAYGPRTHGIRKKSELDAIVEDSLKKAAIWDETKDRLELMKKIQTVYDVIKSPDIDYEVKGTFIRSVVEEIVWNRAENTLSFHLYMPGNP